MAEVKFFLGGGGGIFLPRLRSHYYLVDAPWYNRRLFPRRLDDFPGRDCVALAAFGTVCFAAGKGPCCWRLTGLGESYLPCRWQRSTDLFLQKK